MPKKYEHIEIVEETLNLPSKIKIKYEDGSVEEVDNLYNCQVHLSNFATQTGLDDMHLPFKDIIEKLIIDGKVSDKTGKFEITPPALDAEEEMPEFEDEEKKKRWNIRRIGAWFLTFLLGGGIAYGGFKIISGMVTKANRNNNFIQMIDTPEYDNLSYEAKMDFLEENSDIVIDGLDDMVNGKLESSKDLDQCIENLANISLRNTNEISDYVTGRTSTAIGTAETIDLRFLFDEKTVDFCAVDYFNDLRDDIVSAAYSTKSVSQTKSCVTKFNEEFVSFVFGGKALPYNINGNTVYYTFENLNPAAQMTILTMGMAVLNIEHDFSINVAGVEYNRMVAITNTYELNALVYRELLETQNFTKTK